MLDLLYRFCWTVLIGALVFVVAWLVVGLAISV